MNPGDRPAWLCIEITRTTGWKPRDRSDDDFTTYHGMLRWAVRHGIVDDATAAALDRRATRAPSEAERALARIRRLRSVLHGILSAVGRRREPERLLLAELNDRLTEAAARRRLVSEGGRFVWRWADDPPSLDRVGRAAAISAADLLTSEILDRVKYCAADDCGWIFVDGSRNRSRRWCDMSDCGNRAKVRRYRERKPPGPSK